MPKLGASHAPTGGSLDHAKIRQVDVVFRVQGTLKTCATTLYRREALPVGIPFQGPAVVLQKDTTTVIPPGWAAEAHPSGSLILTHGAAT